MGVSLSMQPNLLYLHDLSVDTGQAQLCCNFTVVSIFVW